jgi:hypothetical protein
VQSFYRPRSHPTGYSVNLRALDGPPLDEFHVEAFDGIHWEDHVEGIR